jgi:hypothetical protein
MELISDITRESSDECLMKDSYEGGDSELDDGELKIGGGDDNNNKTIDKVDNAPVSLPSIPVYNYTMDPVIIQNKMASEFLCSICKFVTKDPCELINCGHVYCLDCITKWKEMSLSCSRVLHCPDCKTSFNPRHTRLSLKINRLINSMNMKCSYCNWGGTVLDFKKHSDPLDVDHRCPRIEVTCDKCDDKVSSSMLQTHVDTQCPCRVVECDKCDEFIAFRDIDSHVTHTCEFTIFKCNEPCTFHGTRNDFRVHSKTCGYAIVDCKYKKNGCTKTVMRKDMHAHLDRKDGLKYHLKLMEKVNNIQEKVIDDKNKVIDDAGIITEDTILTIGQVLFYKGETANIVGISSNEIKLHADLEDGGEWRETIRRNNRFLTTI